MTDYLLGLERKRWGRRSEFKGIWLEIGAIKKDQTRKEVGWSTIEWSLKGWRPWIAAPAGEDACSAVLVEMQGRQTVSFIQGWRLSDGCSWTTTEQMGNVGGVYI